MHLSRFVVTYEDARPGEHVLYSVLEDRYAGVDSATLEAIDRWSRGEGPQDETERETQEVLLEDGFLARDRAHDDARLRGFLHKAREGIPGTMSVTLMPTLACNLACNYCFQKESPAFNKMHREVEDATLEWILRTVDERRLGHLHVHFFGGEPTTRKDFCLRAAEVLHAAMQARGGEFSWDMTTNGVLLDLEFALAMNRYGRGAFKVTLDGDKETHDQMRVYRNGRGSFDQIFENVAAVAPHVRVRIGGNFHADQKESFEKLLDRLESSGVARHLEWVKFKPIMDAERKKPGMSCTGCNGKAEAETLVQLNRSIEKRKLAVPMHHGETLESLLGPCELHWQNNYTIDPDGYVYKCPAVAGRTEVAVGRVTETGPEREAPLLTLRPWEQCGDCPYLPVCMGGCLGTQYLKTGRTDGVACNKEIFERSFRETITKRYLAEFSAGEQCTQEAA